MNFIAHRINTIKELKEIPNHFGVEIDVRDYNNKLVIQHDPFVNGEDFEEYLSQYKNGTLILNVKSERIEYKVLELVKKYNIDDYFLLDSSFPMIYELSRKGEKKIALRFSEFESIETIINFKGKIDWVWVDCFSKLPIDINIFKQLKLYDFKLCLVSPELQGQEEKIIQYKNYLNNNKIIFDAICTKIYNIDKW